MSQTFKERLKLLMKDEKPYTWARRAGIKKGLFQYYWQKGRIPTYENLRKIQDFSGCSLDWLLTGRTVALDRIEDLTFVNEENPVYGALKLRLIKSMKKVNDIYLSRNESDMALLENFLDKFTQPSAIDRDSLKVNGLGRFPATESEKPDDEAK